MELYWKDSVFKYISRADSGSRIWSKVVDLVGVMIWLHQNDKLAAASPTFIVVSVLHQESITSVFKLNLRIELFDEWHFNRSIMESLNLYDSE